MTSEPISNVSDYFREIQEKIKNNEDVIYVFRGEEDDFGETKLSPSIYRNNSPENILELENKMFESVIDYKISNGASCVEKSIDAQHYIAYSRLLDVSFNAMNALFFALNSDENKLEKKGYENKIVHPKVFVFKIPKFMVFSAHSKYIENHFDSIHNHSETIIPTNFKLIGFTLMNERVIAQDGGFLLFPGETCPKIPDVYFETIHLTSNKVEIRKMLDDLKILFNISESKIFPERERAGSKILSDLANRKFIKVVDEENGRIELNILAEKLIYEIKDYRKKKNDNLYTEEEISKQKYFVIDYYTQYYRKILKEFKQDEHTEILSQSKNQNINGEESVCVKSIEEFRKDIELI